MTRPGDTVEVIVTGLERGKTCHQQEGESTVGSHQVQTLKVLHLIGLATALGLWSAMPSPALQMGELWPRHALEKRTSDSACKFMQSSRWVSDPWQEFPPARATQF
jgi:hypothetical protein